MTIIDYLLKITEAVLFYDDKPADIEDDCVTLTAYGGILRTTITKEAVIFSFLEPIYFLEILSIEVIPEEEEIFSISTNFEDYCCCFVGSEDENKEIELCKAVKRLIEKVFN